MANNYQKVKGTQDFYKDDAQKINYVTSFSSSVLEKFGYVPLITPIFENTDVFVKNVGEDSDVVTKEMYTFKDKGDRSLTLRPEGTAAVARFFIENKMYANPGLTKVYYYGPMFRYERPQVGRFREFRQFGVEVYGASSYLLDADVINSAYMIFKGLGIKDLYLEVNSIGDSISRANYSKALKEYYSKYIDTMCDDCKRRINTNPLRILDCKVDANHVANKNAPSIKEYLSSESKEYFNNVLKTLDTLKVPYVVNDKLVRGLDYYTDTVFEFKIKGHGELDGITVCGGGKYANMIKDMCGVDVSGIGYAFGIERAVSIMNSLNLWDERLKKANNVTAIFGLDDQSKLEALKVASDLREKGILTEIDYSSNSMKSQFKLSERCNARYIVIIGENERNSGIYTVKDTINKTQESVRKEDLVKYLR